ncbi:fasciclin domain-containing protein, partial [Methanoculleus sp. UBA208]|uniref:fasciclin domain-containing protein n=1 Tax=Methanoculleus sp. UBA208 TaxID=1915494 RepID=UPI0025E2396D
MRRPVLFGLCIVLLLSISAASTAISIGGGPVELDPDETVNITPVNSTETYEVPQTTVLGALDAASILGVFEYQVAEDLPQEEGNLSILSITDIENEIVNETPNNWTYWVNGEQGTTGPAVTNVTDGDNLTYSYGPPSHTIENASYTLAVNVSVVGAPPVNVTPTPTVNVTPTPTVNVTPTPTVNVTPTPTVNVTPTPTPEVNITEEIAAGLSGQENLTTFVGLVNNSTLGERLEANRSYVICAPTNEAFDGLGNETLSTIMNNTTLLNSILEYHVILGDYTIEELVMLCENSTDGQISLPTVAGTDVNVSLTDGQLLINNIVVVTQIQITNNIVVYVLDGVLIPPDTPIPTPTPTVNVTPTPTVNV